MFVFSLCHMSHPIAPLKPLPLTFDPSFNVISSPSSYFSLSSLTEELRLTLIVSQQLEVSLARVSSESEVVE